MKGKALRKHSLHMFPLLLSYVQMHSQEHFIYKIYRNIYFIDFQHQNVYV